MRKEIGLQLNMMNIVLEAATVLRETLFGGQKLSIKGRNYFTNETKHEA